jgi:hypothetical protein
MQPFLLYIIVGMGGSEVEHEKAREGVLFARRWLNYTTRVDAPWTVYDNPPFTTLSRPDGTRHRFDLAGYFIDPPGRDFYAEVKKYAKQQDLTDQYNRFLANCYSVTTHLLDSGPDRNTQFLWISWAPHSANRWDELTTANEILQACSKKPDLLGGATVKDEFVDLLATRLWLLILSDRHDDLMMKSEYFAHVIAQVKRASS